jgi:hypothetical protein
LDIKRIAAMIGVIYYLRDEGLRKEREETRSIPGRGAVHWALSSRQTIMSGRHLVQRRIFTKKGRLPVERVWFSGRVGRLTKVRNLTGGIMSNIIRSRSKI